MAKSDSTRKPKLPKVYVCMNIHNRPMMVDLTPKMAKWKDETIHQYAPVQKPRRCVWSEAVFQPGQWLLQCVGESSPSRISPYRYNYKFCPYCGGKIKVKS